MIVTPETFSEPVTMTVSCGGATTTIYSPPYCPRQVTQVAMVGIDNVRFIVPQPTVYSTAREALRSPTYSPGRTTILDLLHDTSS